jgi:hypothetical protein
MRACVHVESCVVACFRARMVLYLMRILVRFKLRMSRANCLHAEHSDRTHPQQEQREHAHAAHWALPGLRVVALGSHRPGMLAVGGSDGNLPSSKTPFGLSLPLQPRILDTNPCKLTRNAISRDANGIGRSD